jgi:hypothetical protein
VRAIGQVAFAQAAAVGHGRLGDHDGVETSLEAAAV